MDCQRLQVLLVKTQLQFRNKRQNRQASIGQISDLVKSELGTAAFRNESDFSTPATVAAVEAASQQRDDAQNERIDAVEYGLTAVANGADKSFTTYAQMIAYVPPEPNVSVRNNDSDPALRGTYTWTGTEYVKGYDPLDAANKYTDQKVQTETNRIDKVESVFEEKTTVNLFDKSKAVDKVVLSYLTGLHAAFPKGLSFGKQKVVAGTKYVFLYQLISHLNSKKSCLHIMMIHFWGWIIQWVLNLRKLMIYQKMHLSVQVSLIQIMIRL